MSIVSFAALVSGCDSMVSICLYFFFFQAEDGIRDDLVTGVQTCALPITSKSFRAAALVRKIFPSRSQAMTPSGNVSKIRSSWFDGTILACAFFAFIASLTANFLLLRLSYHAHIQGQHLYHQKSPYAKCTFKVKLMLV